MIAFKREEHRVIAEVLRLMDHAFLMENKCWFGGGTAIVMKLGEYRRSLDIYFVCSDAGGYRALRSAAVERGTRAFFPEPVEALREFRTDQYGLRTVIQLHGQPIRFEVIREARIEVSGAFDADLRAPTLVLPDQFAEKLLANADRCQDKSVSYRDAFDIGMLLIAHGAIPAKALAKARSAYGADIERKLVWVVDRLKDESVLLEASDVLQMEADAAVRAIATLAAECRRLWPDAASDLAPTAS